MHKGSKSIKPLVRVAVSSTDQYSYDSGASLVAVAWFPHGKKSYHQRSLICQDQMDGLLEN